MKRYFMRIIYALLFIYLSGCREEILHLSNEVEANQVILVLRENTIEATKKLTAKEWVIEVPKSDLTRALRILTDSKVPKKEKSKDQEESGKSIFASKQDKDSLRDKELAKELSTILGEIPGIIDAKVSIFNSITDPLSLNVKPDRSASILLVTSGKVELDSNSIKDLVAKGGGITIDKISYITTNSNTSIESIVNNTIPTIEVKQEESISKIQNIDYLQIIVNRKYELAFLSALLIIFFIYFKARNSSNYRKLNKLIAGVRPDQDLDESARV